VLLTPRRARRAVAPALVAIVLLAAGGCAPPVDLTRNLQVLDVSTGWFDAGIVNGQNKLVPMISFKLKNLSSQSLPVLQANVLFHRVSDPNVEWGAGFLSVTGSEGLGAGAATSPLTVKSNLGYTGSDQTRQEMLQNKAFVDATVQVFAKYGSIQWVKMGEYPIARRLVTN
jgi:hypothetical protein